MKSYFGKINLCVLGLLSLFFFILCSELFAAGRDRHSRNDKIFKKAVRKITKIPYNPRPIASNTADVTMISGADSRDLFLSTFERVEINAPANGKTFAVSDQLNRPDITIVGYMAMQLVPEASTIPWIIVTHGGHGQGSIARAGGFLIHIANVLFDNGYNVLALDRRDGLLSRCGYDPETLNPDPSRSQEASVGGPKTLYCENLPYEFRLSQKLSDFKANGLVSDIQAFSSGDTLAAAQFLKDKMGAIKIGALGGSMGGINIIRAAYMQDKPDNDFDPGLLDAVLAFSPVGDFNTSLYISNSYFFPCSIADTVELYSTEVNGTGLRDFTTDQIGAIEDFLDLINGVNIIPRIKIPALIIFTLADPNEGLAYKAKTDKRKLSHTIIMSLLGHFHEIWRSDPYWGDKVVLDYFKELLAHNDLRIGAEPGFPSLGPRTNNPYIIDLKVKIKDVDMLFSQESIAPFLDVCFP